MKEEKIIYKFKSIDKLIVRILIQNEINLKEKVTNHHFPTPTQMQIMEYILEHKDEVVYQKDLEKVLNLRRATVSGVFQTMEKNHLIERIKDSSDARNKKVILNAKAKEMFLKREKELAKLETIILKDISKEELDVFLAVLNKIKENLKDKLEEVNKERKK